MSSMPSHFTLSRAQSVTTFAKVSTDIIERLLPTSLKGSGICQFVIFFNKPKFPGASSPQTSGNLKIKTSTPYKAFDFSGNGNHPIIYKREWGVY